MRKCTDCSTLYDNGARICERCGTKFPYDPKVTPFSERRIALILIVFVMVVLAVFNHYISMPITDTSCSRINYLRVQKMLHDSRDRVMRIQDHGYIPISGPSIIMQERYFMENINLPPCFEPIRRDMIDYYLIMHTVTRISSFGGHTYTVPLLEEAVMLQNRVDQKMEEIDKCLPDCPTSFVESFQARE